MNLSMFYKVIKYQKNMRLKMESKIHESHPNKFLPIQLFSNLNFFLAQPSIESSRFLLGLLQRLDCPLPQQQLQLFKLRHLVHYLFLYHIILLLFFVVVLLQRGARRRGRIFNGKLGRIRRVIGSG